MKIKLEHFQQIIPLRLAASTDETRFHLCGVNFNLKTGTGTATNGHAMAEAKANLETAETDFTDPDSVIIPSEALAAIAKVKPRDIGLTTISISKDKTCLNQPGFEQCWNNINGTFPNTDCIWDQNKGDAIAEIGIDAELLVAAARAIKSIDSRKGNALIKIKFFDKHSPVVIESQERRGLVMPCRL